MRVSVLKCRTYEVCPLRTQTTKETARWNAPDRRIEVTMVTALPEAILKIRAIAVRTLRGTFLKLT